MAWVAARRAGERDVMAGVGMGTVQQRQGRGSAGVESVGNGIGGASKTEAQQRWVAT